MLNWVQNDVFMKIGRNLPVWQVATVGVRPTRCVQPSTVVRKDAMTDIRTVGASLVRY